MKTVLKYTTPILLFVVVAYIFLLGYTLTIDDTAKFSILLVLPFVAIGGYVFLYHTEYLFHVLMFSLPFSLNLRDIGLGVGLSIPAELITVILLVAVVGKIMYKYDEIKEILWHPVSLLIYVNIAWMLVTTFTSSIFIVSVKFMIIRIIYVLVYYIYAAFLFKKEKMIKSFIWLYGFGISIVIGIVFAKHVTLGLGQDTSNKISYPFYDDHTIYAACVVMMIPLALALFRLHKKANNIAQLGIIFLLSVLVIGLLHSYSRAGWISIAGITVGWIIFKLRISFLKIMIALSLLVGWGIMNHNSLLENLNSNEKDSGGDVLEHAQSATNISTDASNTERINRWACAIRMAKHKPVIGFGPGTYMFQYGKFQKRDEMTIISVRDGSWGGVHSEYLKPFSESGYIGLLTFLVFVFYGIKVGMDIIYETDDKKTKVLIIATVLSFVSYLIHGFVNFFLDTDKSSVLFWAMLAIITVTDIQHKKKKKEINAPNF